MVAGKDPDITTALYLYAGSTIRQAYIAMGTMFRAAVMNDIIGKHLMDGVRYTKPVRAVGQRDSPIAGLGLGRASPPRVLIVAESPTRNYKERYGRNSRSNVYGRCKAHAL